jgi:hypothetical protein
MSASTSPGAPNIFAGALSELTELEVINKTKVFVDLLREANLGHGFSDSVCCHRLRIWEETINSPASE